MGWSSFIDSVAQAAQSVAKADSDFKQGVASGAWQGLKSMATGFKDLAVGGYHLATDAAARERAGQVLSRVADAGARLATNPEARAQAYDQTAQAIGRAREQFVAAHKRAADEGRLASFYGEAAGRAGFEVGAIFVPVSKLGAVAKAGKAAEAADVVADTTKVARVAEGLAEARPASVVTVCKEVGQGVLSEAKVGEIRAIAKGSRPPVTDYLPAEYIDAHLQQFEGGASRLMLKSNLDKYGVAQRDGTAFVMPSREIDELLAKAGGDPRKLEEALGLPSGMLDANELVRVDIPQPKGLNLRMPSGNEAGANDLWIPGGKLPDGGAEAVLDAGALAADQFTVTPLLKN